MTIAFGALMTIVGFLGCCGAIKESRCLLTMASVFQCHFNHFKSICCSSKSTRINNMLYFCLVSITMWRYFKIIIFVLRKWLPWWRIYFQTANDWCSDDYRLEWIWFELLHYPLKYQKCFALGRCIFHLLFGGDCLNQFCI